MRFLIVSTLLCVAVFAQRHYQCHEPEQFSCQVARLWFDTNSCVSGFSRGFIAQDSKQEMKRMDLHIFNENTMKMSNITIWQFYMTNTQYTYDRVAKTCTKTNTGPWQNTWFTNGTWMGSVMSGLQMLEHWMIPDESTPQLLFSVYQTEGFTCIPVRVDVFNTTAQSIALEDSIYDWTTEVDGNIFQDLPAACSSAKEVPRSRSYSSPWSGKPFIFW